MRYLWIILFALVTVSTAQTKSRLDILPYTLFSSYDGALSKNRTIVGGVYAFYGYGPEHSFEMDAAYTKINYRGFSYLYDGVEYRQPGSSLNQTDISFNYTNYQLTDLRLNLGMHGIFTDDALTDKSYVLFAGINRYRDQYYETGVNVYYSLYENYVPSLNVIQTDAWFGFYLGNYFTGPWFYSELRGTYIRLSEEIGFAQTQLPSVQYSLSYFSGNWTAKAEWWTGYRIFAVTGKGFVVYNLAEKHLNAFSLSLRRVWNAKISAEFKWSRELFKEPFRGEIVKAMNYTMVFGYTF